MADFELVLTPKDGPGKRFKVKSGGLFIGRHVENDIVLPSQLVSRRHAHVWFEGEALRVQDLESSNGIEVNGQSVETAALQEGDSLRIGNDVFRVVRCTDSTLGHTVITSDAAAELCDAMAADTRGARLPVLYRAAQLLGTVFELDDLLSQILALIFEAIPVRRGFILTFEDDGATPRIHASLSKEADDQGPPLSNTLIEHVLQRREAMLTVDAQDDSRFDSTASIVGHGIHSAMCAPLHGREAMVGAIYVDSGGQPVHFPRGDLELLTAIARVVGVAVENAQLYQDKVKRERMAAIGEATAGLGHCIKNILTGIRGGAEIINEAIERDDIAFVGRGWRVLSLSIERIDMLVQNLMTFSRPRTPERIPTDMNALVNQVLDVVRTRAERAKVDLNFIPNGEATCPADAREIFRALLNLVTNAVEACEGHGGAITVMVGVSPEQCVIRVADTGRGIPPEMLPKLSQAFVSTKGSSGTGLGLACTYKIAAEHKGRVEVESEPGQGTIFTLYLPTGDALPEPAPRVPCGARDTINSQPDDLSSGQ